MRNGYELETTPAVTHTHKHTQLSLLASFHTNQAAGAEMLSEAKRSRPRPNPQGRARPEC